MVILLCNRHVFQLISPYYCHPVHHLFSLITSHLNNRRNNQLGNLLEILQLNRTSNHQCSQQSSRFGIQHIDQVFSRLINHFVDHQRTLRNNLRSSRQDSHQCNHPSSLFDYHLHSQRKFLRGNQSGALIANPLNSLRCFRLLSRKASLPTNRLPNPPKNHPLIHLFSLLLNLLLSHRIGQQNHPRYSLRSNQTIIQQKNRRDNQPLNQVITQQSVHRINLSAFHHNNLAVSQGGIQPCSHQINLSCDPHISLLGNQVISLEGHLRPFLHINPRNNRVAYPHQNQLRLLHNRRDCLHQNRVLFRLRKRHFHRRQNRPGSRQINLHQNLVFFLV